MSVIMRPSSIPLPTTLSHSNPAERLNLRRKGSFHHRSSLILMPLSSTRSKLTSTSSSLSTDSCSPSSERQVKSLTPERDFALNVTNNFKNNNNNNNNNTNNNNSAIKIVSRTCVKTQHSSTINVKTKGTFLSFFHLLRFTPLDQHDFVINSSIDSS